MLIQSNFRDYYDPGQVHFSPEPVYRRLTKTLEEVPNLDFPVPYSTDSFHDFHAVGFCGKVYPCFSLLENIDGGYSSKGRKILDHDVAHYFYSLQTLEVGVLKYKGQEAFQDYCTATIGHKAKWYQYSSRKYVEKLFESYQKANETGVFAKYFQDNLCPIFLVQPNHRYGNGWTWENKEKYKWHHAHNGTKHLMTITYNPILKDLGFQKIFGVNQAFQEVEMWLSNQAFPDKPIPNIDDATLAEAKGFDKFSFRKDKRK